MERAHKRAFVTMAVCATMSFTTNDEFNVLFYFFLSIDIFPQQIEGIKMIVNKTLGSFFKVSFY